jgi:hypothetical protein
MILLPFSTMEKEAPYFFEIFVNKYPITWQPVPEDNNLLVRNATSDENK